MRKTARWFTMALVAITLLPALAPTAFAVSATGGNVTNDIDGYRIHTFTSSGIFTATAGGNFEVLVVAGGGGGGGGGGGAGGFLSTTTNIATTDPITVTVGAGGSGGSAGSSGNNGNNSVFGTLTAIGGGGAGRF